MSALWTAAEIADVVEGATDRDFAVTGVTLCGPPGERRKFRKDVRHEIARS